MTPRTALHRSLRPLLVAATVGALACTPLAGATPPPVPSVVVSGPQGAVVGFATPTVLSVQGQSLTFFNADTVGHTVTSKATKAKRVKFGKKYYTIRVPLFDSGNVSPVAAGDVKGVTGLKPGSYAFYCSAHTGMTGELVVNPGA